MSERFPDETWDPVIVDPGFISLRRAFNRIGRSRFGTDWTGDEWVSRPLEPISVDSSLRTSQLVSAAELGIDQKTGRTMRIAPSPQKYEAEANAYSRWREVFWPVASWLSKYPDHAKLMDLDGRIYPVPRTIWQSKNAEEFVRSALAKIQYDGPALVSREGALLLTMELVNTFEDPAIRPPSPRWSLLQALAWACTRDRALVVRAAPGPGHNLLWLQSQIDADLPGQVTTVRDGQPVKMRAQGAGELIGKMQTELLDRLKGDPLGSSGLGNNVGDPTDMRAEHYQASRLAHDDRDGLCLVPDDPNRAGASTWARVTLSTARVMAEWQEPPTAPMAVDGSAIASTGEPESERQDAADAGKAKVRRPRIPGDEELVEEALTLLRTRAETNPWAAVGKVAGRSTGRDYERNRKRIYEHVRARLGITGNQIPVNNGKQRK